MFTRWNHYKKVCVCVCMKWGQWLKKDISGIKIQSISSRFFPFLLFLSVCTIKETNCTKINFSGEKIWASVDLDVSVPCMLWVILEAEQTDTDLLVSGGSDKFLRVWKRKQEEEGMTEVLEMVGVFGVQSGTIQALAQNSTYLATASGRCDWW